jgi:hypothetical protein
MPPSAWPCCWIRGISPAARWLHPVAEHPRSGDNVRTALAAQPELTKLAGHTEPDSIAEAYLAGQGQPVSVAAAEGLQGGHGPHSDMRRDAAVKGNPAASVAAVGNR